MERVSESRVQIGFSSGNQFVDTTDRLQSKH
jgi:hypothetical protein